MAKALTTKIYPKEITLPYSGETATVDRITVWFDRKWYRFSQATGSIVGSGTIIREELPTELMNNYDFSCYLVSVLDLTEDLRDSNVRI